MRIHLFEFEDLPWFPEKIRRGGTDYLRYFLDATKFYQPAVKVLRALMAATGEQRITDLCSGGGGNMLQIFRELEENKIHAQITLTDRFPNTTAFAHLQKLSGGKIGYLDTPVDAACPPLELQGIRTIFSAMHHFRPAQVKAILRHAVESGQPIAVFDGGNKNALTILGILLVQPITFFALTPFFRPFRLWRLLFTYLIPAIPLMTMWDGVVSVLRLYTPAELLRLAKKAEPHAYHWEAGKLKNSVGMQVTYLTGHPIVKRSAYSGSGVSASSSVS